MKAVDAIVRILSEAGGPLHYREITHQLMTQKLWSSKAKTPSNVIYNNLRSEPSRFRLVDRGIWTLTDTDAFKPVTARPTNGADSSQHIQNATPTSEASSTKSYLDAAAEILRRNGAERPMHYRVITESAIAHGLLAPKGVTPEISLNAQISMDIKRRRLEGKPQRFERVTRGYVKLVQPPAKGLRELIEQHNQKIRSSVRQRLHEMDASDFEELIGELLSQLGFQEVVVTGKSGDGGIDVRGTLVVGDVIHVNMAVQVKRWKQNVQAPIVQQVRGSLGTHDQGLIITTSDFSSGAKEEASRSDAIPVGLMNGDQLVSLLTEYQLGVKRGELYVLELAAQSESSET